MFRRWSLVIAAGVACAAWADAPAIESTAAALPVVVVTGVGRPDLERRADAPLAIAVFAGGETLRDQWRQAQPVRPSRDMTAVGTASDALRVQTAGR